MKDMEALTAPGKIATSFASSPSSDVPSEAGWCGDIISRHSTLMLYGLYNNRYKPQRKQCSNAGRSQAIDDRGYASLGSKCSIQTFTVYLATIRSDSGATPQASEERQFSLWQSLGGWRFIVT